MASLDILSSNLLNFKNKIMKIEHNILWPIKNFEKYFITHQCLPKTFHDPHIHPQLTQPPPTYPS